MVTLEGENVTPAQGDEIATNGFRGVAFKSRFTVNARFSLRTRTFASAEIAIVNAVSVTLFE